MWKEDVLGTGIYCCDLKSQEPKRNALLFDPAQLSTLFNTNAWVSQHPPKINKLTHWVLKTLRKWALAPFLTQKALLYNNEKLIQCRRGMTKSWFKTQTHTHTHTCTIANCNVTWSLGGWAATSFELCFLWCSWWQSPSQTEKHRKMLIFNSNGMC